MKLTKSTLSGYMEVEEPSREEWQDIEDKFDILVSIIKRDIAVRKLRAMAVFSISGEDTIDGERESPALRVYSQSNLADNCANGELIARLMSPKNLSVGFRRHMEHILRHNTIAQAINAFKRNQN